MAKQLLKSKHFSSTLTLRIKQINVFEKLLSFCMENIDFE